MKLTVFTPLYNRTEFLPRIFDSLMSQKYKDFEWLIVDDGSVNDSEHVIKEFEKTADFSIRYVRKENGGKHTAHNLAVEEAFGEWFVCLDSDDIFAEDALALFCTVAEKTEFDILTAYKQTLNGEMLCDKLSPEDNGKGIYTLLTDKHGEYVFFFKTALIKKFPYPVFKNEKFSSECIVYDRLEIEGYKTGVIDGIVQNCEYQMEGLSNNFRKLLTKNPRCFQIVHMQRVDLSKTFKLRLIHSIKYCAFRILSKFDIPKYEGKHKFTVFCAYPLGVLAAIYYKIR